MGIARTYANLGPRRGWITAVFVLVMLALTAAGIQAFRFAAGVLTGLPGRTELQQMSRMAQATTIFDREGQPAFSLSKEQRLEVRLNDISPRVIQALIAVEDQRFYSHQGYDPVRLVAAAWANLRERRAAQGASTLTQQLARQSFLTPDKTVQRKLREIVLANRIERLFTKREILELYLNKVYFGDGLYGIEAASRGYFGCGAPDLSTRAGRAARRPGAVAVGLRPDGPPRAGGGAPQRRAAGDARRGRDRPARLRRGPGRDGRPARRAAARGRLGAPLQGAGAARTGEPVRNGAGVRGRPSRSHDDRRRDAAAGRDGHQGDARAARGATAQGKPAPAGCVRSRGGPARRPPSSRSTR